ncbi:hypothetical protein GCM10011519_20380 [Marmoricola endophyticus]|uniref:Amidohydrolase n=1 Tax=Marmoricola endophyticus TaxID=2040280 RepID=A0A917F2F1_9ACTN|nr:amidohydrolase family protein [Marmoricola endophyticus]GGF46347.1 hypothetical protein GCM10011519_20380 [Marmoricola endophyticus]
MPLATSAGEPGATDVHQHLWPEDLLDRLRARAAPPYLRGWTLHTAGEPEYEVDPAAHDASGRVATDLADGTGTACVSLSSPLGVEALPRPEASRLIDAWHRGVRGLPDHFRAWASVPELDPDPAELGRLLAEPRFVGLQLPATTLSTPGAWERVAPLLSVAESADRPVLIHPGPVRRAAGDAPVPEWWAPVVGYGQQLHAAWWAWRAYVGRASHPQLRLVFAAAAGLAPLHEERHLVRGGSPEPVDPGIFVDSSGHGPRSLDAVVRVLGIDALVLGSDRPYAVPTPLGTVLGEAGERAVRADNPRRLLGTPDPTSSVSPEGAPRWAYAS